MSGAAKRVIRDRSRAELLAALVAGGGFVLLGGLPGAASAAAVGLVWLVLPAVYAVALGHVLVAALTIGGVAPLAVLTAEFGLFAMLLTPAATLAQRETLVSMTVFVLGVFAFVFGIAFLVSEVLWIGALVLLLVGVFASYGLHRYELVILGLVEETT